MAMNKDLRKMLDAVTRQGFTVTMASRGSHMRVKAPSGATVTIPGTSSDRRYLLVIRRKLRKIGAIL